MPQGHPASFCAEWELNIQIHQIIFQPTIYNLTSIPYANKLAITGLVAGLIYRLSKAGWTKNCEEYRKLASHIIKQSNNPSIIRYLLEYSKAFKYS